MANGGIARSCLGEYIEPLVPIVMNTYDNRYSGKSVPSDILTTSSTYEFRSPPGSSDGIRSMEKLIFK